MIKGLIQIYSGEGKGKTTAAIGQAIRAVGHDLKVGVVFFHKRINNKGEYKILKQLGVDIFEAAPVHPCFDKGASTDEIRRLCLNGLQMVDKLFKDNKYDVLVIDELNICLKDGFLKESEIIDLLKTKPQELELILTGRGVSRNLIKQVDLVSIIQPKKHPYNKGIKARKGVEY